MSRDGDQAPGHVWAGARSLAVFGALVLGLGLYGAACGDDEDQSAAPTDTTGEQQAEPVGTATGEGGPPADDEGPADDRPAPSGEEQIEAAIESFLVSGDPEIACRRVVTERLLRLSYGDRAGCTRAVKPASAAQSVAVDEVEIEDGRATAVATPRGGPSNGEHLEVTLVRQKGSWRIDQLTSNVPVGP